MSRSASFTSRSRRSGFPTHTPGPQSMPGGTTAPAAISAPSRIVAKSNTTARMPIIDRASTVQACKQHACPSETSSPMRSAFPSCRFGKWPRTCRMQPSWTLLRAPISTDCTVQSIQRGANNTGRKRELDLRGKGKSDVARGRLTCALAGASGRC
eukprot:1175889-Rhodomonas_salina.1